MRQLLSVAMSVLVIGCTADESEPPAETCDVCEQRSGSYTAFFSETSGSCGAIADQSLNVDAQPKVPPPPCYGGEIRYSDDNCQVTNIDIQCPETGVGPGAWSVARGVYDWSCDAASGSGWLELQVMDSTGLLCESRYSVSIRAD